MAANIRHSSKTSEHYTRAPEVAMARAVLGGIDLDPFSSREANKTIQALRFFTPKDDGFARLWEGRLFVNPPGGQLTVPKEMPKDSPEAIRRKEIAKVFGTRSMAVAAWRKLAHHYELRQTRAAVFIGFSLELAQASQQNLERAPSRLLPLDCTFVVPARRMRFEGNSPSHGNIVVYLGPDRDLFRKVFGTIGKVVG